MLKSMKCNAGDCSGCIELEKTIDRCEYRRSVLWAELNQ